MSKIVFFDIDGTLLNHDKTIPESTKKAIRQLKEQDVFVAIATGRAPFMFEDIRKELDIDSYVSFNGQYVVFENEPIYKNPLNQEALIKLHNKAKSHHHPLVFLNESDMKADILEDVMIAEAMGSLRFGHPEKDETFYLKNEVYQSLLFCKDEWQQEYEREFTAFTFIRWHEYSVDVIPKCGSKAEGIKKMLEKVGFQLKDSYAFGDGLNDIEMIQTVGTGVAMGNAVEDLKIHANFITKNVDEEGIVYGLKSVGLLR
ncbi:MAG TPA: Cof-type HAD-IIB family hydrolase [Bacillus sp. (in: firmicutes)]|nr:Cof-type HAD-IIB family hydrolase [Bacillus sp. (in: firmicutes)]